MKLEITSEKFPGHVILPDAWGWPELLAFNDMLEIVSQSELRPDKKTYQMLPFMLKLVKEWHLEGWPEKPQTVDDVPCKPLNAVVTVLLQVFNAIREQLQGEAEIPLASPPAPG